MIYCRLTPNEKLPDRFLFSGILKNPDESLFLCYLIEITKPWFPTSRVAPIIINELKGNLSQINGSQNTLESFEESLKDVNEALFTLSEQGETEWIGNLNSLITIIKDREIHIAQTGSLPGYLFRKQKINQITEGLSFEKETHPLKTFSSIISGQVEKGDRILLANHELFNVLSLDMLRQIIANNSPYQSSLSILRSLKKQRVMTVSSIIINASDSAVIEPEPDVITIEDGFDKWHKKAWKKLKPKVIETAKSIKISSQKAHQAYQEKISPRLKDYSHKSFESLKSGSQKATAFTKEKIIPGVKGRVEKITHRVEPDQKVEQANKSVQQLKQTEKLIEEKVSPKTSFVANNFKKSFISLNKKRLFYISGIIILIIIATLIIRLNGNDTKTAKVRSSSSAKVISQIKNNIQKAEDFKTSGQNDQAIEKLNTALDLTNSLKNKSDATKKQSLKKEALTLRDELTKTTQIYSVQTITFTDPLIDQLEIISPYFYVGSSKNNNIYSQAVGTLSSAAETKLTLNTSINRGVKDMFWSESGNTNQIMVATGDGQIFTLTNDGANSTVTEIIFSLGKFAATNAVNGYYGNLYLLDGSTGLLWKYPPSANSYGKGINQVDINSVDIKTGVSLAIDGYIYVLKSDGNVIKLLKGLSDTTFNLAKLPGNMNISKPLKIMTTMQGNSIYILDGGIKNREQTKVVEFDKNGNFIRQVALPDTLDDARDAIIKPNSNKLWVLSGSKVYEFDLP